MSYGMSAALQAAVFQHLTSDVALAALVGTDIFDAVPAGVVPSLFVSLGPEEVQDASDKTGDGATHLFTVSVVTDVAGFQSAKTVAAAVSDALVGAALPLSRGALVSLRFQRAVAKRSGDLRQIDLRFRARVEETAP